MDWVYLTDQSSNKSYYANLSTRETSWNLPPALGGSEEPLYVKLRDGWFQFEDEASGRPYYWHKHSKRTVWVMPPEARPAQTGVGDAAIFEEGMRGEAEGEGEEEDDEDEDEDEDEVDLQEPLARKSFVERAADEAKKAEKRTARRLKILEEILLSERMYVQQLSTLNNVYLVPLRTVADPSMSGKGQIFTHADLDAIFMNIDTIVKVNEAFLAELETELELRRGEWPQVRYGEIIKRAARQFKGCYTRYVTNYDASSEHLGKLASTDKDKHRYLEVCKTHPDAGGLDVRSFLIQPVQRVPRYRMLLEDLLKHTDADHADEAPLKEALARVCEVAMHINEEKRHLDEVEKLRTFVQRFVNCEKLEKELVSYERRLLREGTLSKLRMSKTQIRQVFLCNDVLLYGARNTKPGVKGQVVLKGRIWLHDGARVALLPSTETAPHAFAVVARGGKGYTWLAESAAEQKEWFEAIRATIEDNNEDAAWEKGPRRTKSMSSREASQMLSLVQRKPIEQRVEALKLGTCLTKYNVRDGKSSLRWVKLTSDAKRVTWGDAKTRKCDASKGLSLDEATALIHGAQSSAFFKQSARSTKSIGEGGKKDEDWKCLTLVFRERTLDLAADSAGSLLDWYLALASLMPNGSTEPLMSEDELRARILTMASF